MVEFDFPYTNLDLTVEVNRMPNEFGLLQKMNIAPIEGKKSKFVRIDRVDGVLQVLSHKDRAAPAEQGEAEKASGAIIEIPHFPQMETILVEDADNLLEVINGKVSPRSFAGELAKKLLRIRKNHNMTLEFLRLGMLRGEIVDGSGQVLLNLYDAFDVEKKTVDFKLKNKTTDVWGKCLEVTGHVDENLKGENLTSVAMLVDSNFMTDLVSHPKVVEWTQKSNNANSHRDVHQKLVGGLMNRVFNFGNIDFIEYRGSMPVKEGGKLVQKPNVAKNSGSAFPVGTSDLMKTFECAPLDIQGVNTKPDRDTIKISAEPLRHNKGVELLSETNRIAINKQPETLVQVVST